MARAARKPAPAPKSQSSADTLFLGCFLFDEFAEKDRSGTFQIVVRAAKPIDALEEFRRCLRRLRRDTTLFRDPCTIYLDGVVKLTGPFQQGTLVNMHSYPSQESWILHCLIPEQEDHDGVAYEFKPDKKGKGKDDASSDAFLDFGAAKVIKERRAAAEARPTMPPYAPPGKSAKDIEKERARKRADADARKERVRALDATLSELGRKKPKTPR